MKLFDLIEKIAQEPKRTLKEKLLEDHKDLPNLKRALEYAYNPRKQFYIGPVQLKELEQPNRNGKSDINDSTFDLLDKLVSRKLTGDIAFQALNDYMYFLNEGAAEIFWRILKKDMRAGFSDKTVLKVFPKLIPEYPYQRCSLPDKSDLAKWKWSEKEPHYSQEKADGMFANVNVVQEDGKNVFVEILSRQGTSFPAENLISLCKEIGHTFPAGTQTHGELVVWKSGKILAREIGNGILNSIAQGEKLPSHHRILFVAWDQIPLDMMEKGEYKKPYHERFAALQNQLDYFSDDDLDDLDGLLWLIPTRMVSNESDANRHAMEQVQSGKEGTILKNRNAIWKDGTSKQQVKFKNLVDVDLEIVQMNPGEGKFKDTFGSLECQSRCGKLSVNVSGFSDDTREHIKHHWDDYKKHIMTVRANGLMNPTESNGGRYSLFLPRAVFARLDKTKADSLEEIQDQFRNAVRIV